MNKIGYVRGSARPRKLWTWRLWRSIPFGDVYPLIVRHCHRSLWRSIPFGDVYPLTLIVVVSVVGPKSRCWWRIGANGLTCSFQPRYSSGIAAPVSTSMRSALPRSIAIIVTEVHLRRVTPTTESLQRKGEEAGVPIIRRQLRSWHGAANGLTKRAAWSWQ